MKKILLLWVLFAPTLFISSLKGQAVSTQPGTILQKLEKLNVLGTMLYVAAHPDDENTRLISYYANEKRMRAGYLSATRGDGGQNLIGPEIREDLGVIRTQELLAARSIDGGKQFFSRANDFGYSKNPDETFTIWNRDQVLADFVWTFRKFRPDVVITRFNSEGVNHGHHTASAILAKEAFELSGDPNAYPEQLDYVETWKPKKLFWNTGWWWFRNGGDTTGLSSVNMGSYNPYLGASNGEIAAKSRSMHKSQGFGTAGTRGDQIEYLQQWAGPSSKIPFEGIDVSWNRVEGAEEVAFFINKAIEAFDPAQPWLIAESLVLAKKALSRLEDGFWKDIKTKELDDLILSVTGLYLSLTTESDFYTPGDSVQIKMELVNRSPVAISLDQVKLNSWINPLEFKTKLLPDKPMISEINFMVPTAMDYTTPYWLKEKATLGMYSVAEQQMIGLPQNTPPLLANIQLTVGGEAMNVEVPVNYRRTDPVKGEVNQPITIGPSIMMNVNASVIVFGSDDPKPVEVRLIAGKNKINGRLELDLPKGWRATPSSVPFDLMRKGEEKVFTFQVTPPKKASQATLKAKATVDGKTYDHSKTTIEYDHIPTQNVYPKAEINLVRLDLKKKGQLIGYIEGAGDAIPENLSQIGYDVEILTKDEIEADALAKYDAIILGVRAFNTVDWLSFKNKDLFQYVENGGTVVVQYNTNRRLVTEKVAPYDLTISRDRVTIEQAPVKMIAPDHEVLNSPNKITNKDFEGWVQERGLYFPNEWSAEYTPILSSKDEGETAKNGGLLVAKYGKGHYVYTGYSWFRELPAGVPGAYRLFVNLISLGND